MDFAGVMMIIVYGFAVLATSLFLFDLLLMVDDWRTGKFRVPPPDHPGEPPEAE